MEALPPVGSAVELRHDGYGYAAGSRGSVVRTYGTAQDAVLVRFERTGHTLVVELSDLELVAEPQDEHGARSRAGVEPGGRGAAAPDGS